VAINVVRPLLLALAYMHSERIMHRAVYPENVFWGRDGKLRLGNYDCMVDLVRGPPKDKGHFLDYMAPEVVSMMVRACESSMWLCHKIPPLAQTRPETQSVSKTTTRRPRRLPCLTG
jgi:serine/threonine protein kinase